MRAATPHLPRCSQSKLLPELVDFAAQLTNHALHPNQYVQFSVIKESKNKVIKPD
jgi:hypothetical protein